MQPFIRAGLVNSLTQTVIKLTAPGVPDIYQGSESLNFTLVDPDNRQVPDYGTLSQNLLSGNRALFSDEAAWRDGRVKHFVTATLLQLRQQHNDLLHHGEWLSLKTEGERANNVLAYARIWHEEVLIVVVPRLAFDVTAHALPADYHLLWGDTQVILPEKLAGKHYRNLFTHDSYAAGRALDLSETEAYVKVLIGIAEISCTAS